MAIVGVGIDVVSIPAFAEQVDQPGTVFAATFTPGELGASAGFVPQVGGNAR